ncbi:MAG: Ku protein [Solirubrobacterales bacterium]|nr:Ku protein [Solirubrobacterales bacterium]
MPRAIWTGAVSFGLVNVPVKLFTATSQKTVRFNQLNADTGARIRQRRVDESTGEEVPQDKLVKGYELSKDNYVQIDPDALAALEAEKSQTIDVSAFVSLDQIDPIYYDGAYYLAPAKGGAKPYKLLTQALEQEHKVAIGTFVLRSKQKLCALRAAGDVLMLETMLWGDEVNPTDDLDGMDQVEKAKASEQELEMARQLIQMQTRDFDPSEYRDEHREQVLSLIEATAAGEKPAPAPKPSEPKAAPDLMAALEASLAAAGKGSGSQAKKKSAANGAKTRSKSKSAQASKS